MRLFLKCNLVMACLALLFLSASCNEDKNGGNPHAEIIKSIDNIGLHPSAIAKDDDYVYIVDSGNNTIDRLDKKTHQYTDAFIDLGQDAGTCAIHLDGENIYIVNNMAANVVKTTKSAPTKHEIIANKDDGLIAPTSVATGSGYIVITDTDFSDSSDENRREYPKLLIIKPDATRKHYELYKHPTQIIYVNHGENGKNSFFTFITARSKTFAKDGKLNTPAYNSINVISVSTMQDEVIALSSIGNDNSLSNIVASKESVFIGSNSKAHISKFSFDDIKYFVGLDTMIFNTPNKSSMFIPAVLNERYLFVADFINDDIILLDQTYVSPYELDEYTTQLIDKPATRKGPIGMVYDAPTKMLYVLNKLSASIDIIKITLP